LPEISAAELADVHSPAPLITAHQLAEALTRNCLTRIFPAAPPHPRLLLLDLHQALPAALAALLPDAACAADERQTRLQQALADSRALLLSRLNERRAQLAAFGPLLILLPEDWTKPAAQYAPDLWTQRLSSLYLAPPVPCAEDRPAPSRIRCASAEAAPALPSATSSPAGRKHSAAGKPNACRSAMAGAADTSAKLGNGQEAEDLAALCLRLAYERGSLREQMVSQNILGDMRLRRGRIEQAREAYTLALSIAQALVSEEPDNSEWRRDLSVSYEKVADILRRSDPAAALVNYEASLKIRQDLARREPDNTEWQRDLSVSYNNVADILGRSAPTAALVNYQASLKIRQDLTRHDPDNTEWQRDLSVSYDK
jgi:tetratricopeptide (TPR) repeat protein